MTIKCGVRGKWGRADFHGTLKFPYGDGGVSSGMKKMKDIQTFKFMSKVM